MTRYCALSVLALLLSGCGQTGPLYHPAPDSPPVAQQPRPSADEPAAIVAQTSE